MKKLLTGLMVFASFAATAASFSYQGVLKKSDGTNFADTNRNPEITFRLYDKAESELTQALWGRKIKVLLDKDGLFNVELSDSDSVGDAVSGLSSTLDKVLSQYGNSTLYIGMEVDTSTGEIRPRQKLPAVPTASFAQDAKTARGDFKIEGNATISGALTVEKDVTLKGMTTIQELTVTNGATLNGATKIEKLMVGGIDYASIPSGVIVAWSGTVYDIPNGWVLCDGNNNTPNLVLKFIKGTFWRPYEGVVESYGIGATSGLPFYALCFIMKKYSGSSESSSSDDDFVDELHPDDGEELKK